MRISFVNLGISLLVAVCILIFHKYFFGLKKKGNVIIIVNNRVPRCGSSLLKTLFKQLSNETKSFTFDILDGPHGSNHRLNVQAQNKLRHTLIDYVNYANNKHLVIMKHFHFVPFAPEPGVSFYYINQIRDPMARTLSNFDYKRSGCAMKGEFQGCQKLSPTAAKLKLAECLVGPMRHRCITKENGVQSAISYFCGQSSICDDSIVPPRSEKALALAKSNIEKYYHHVGVLEYLTDSIQLLEHSLPHVFNGISRIYKGLEQKRVNAVPTELRTQLGNRSLEMLRELLDPEYELYAFIKQRFIHRFRTAFHRDPVEN